MVEGFGLDGYLLHGIVRRRGDIYVFLICKGIDETLSVEATPEAAPDAAPEAAPAGEPSYDDAPVAMPAEDDIPEPSGEEGTALSVQENNGEEVEL